MDLPLIELTRAAFQEWPAPVRAKVRSALETWRCDVIQGLCRHFDDSTVVAVWLGSTVGMRFFTGEYEGLSVLASWGCAVRLGPLLEATEG